MKRVKVMLSAILVMAIVAGAFAFKAKSFNVCAYYTTLNATTTKTVCPLVAEGDFNTAAGQAIDYATTLQKPIGGCLSQADCIKTRVTVEE